MTYSNHKINQLLDIIKKNDVAKTELQFIMSYLSQEHRDQLERLLKEEKVHVKHKTPKVDLQNPFYSGVITIFEQPIFAAEFACAYAKINKTSRIAILDLDRFNPTLDVYLNVNYQIKNVYSHLDFDRSTGINLLIDALHKNKLNHQYIDHLSIKVNGLKNLHYFSGSYLIEDYEYYKLEDLKSLCLYLKNNYDVIVLHTNAFIYDAFTCYALMISDLNILAVKGEVPHIKERRKYMRFLSEKQHIPKEKNYYVLFDHQKNQMKPSIFHTLVSGYSLGNIPFSLNRHHAMVQSYKLTKKMSNLQLSQYEKIIKAIPKKAMYAHEFNKEPSYSTE